jgi:hypothetical protein
MMLSDHDDIKTLARFRLGMHCLNVEKLRHVPCSVGGLPPKRSTRVCNCCNMGVVEDEAHFILYCPKYDAVRKLFPLVFDSQLTSGIGESDHRMGTACTDGLMHRMMCPDDSIGLSTRYWTHLTRFLDYAMEVQSSHLSTDETR